MSDRFNFRRRLPKPREIGAFDILYVKISVIGAAIGKWRPQVAAPCCTDQVLGNILPQKSILKRPKKFAVSRKNKFCRGCNTQFICKLIRNLSVTDN